jgi:hypothetical protein
MAARSRAVLSLSSPVMVSRRLTGVPAARLADSWRMRRSPPYLKQWIPAAKLKKGEHLKTPNGAVATADGSVTPKDHVGWMWDLTVPGNNDHDFYVITGSSGILVHNDDPVIRNPVPPDPECEVSLSEAKAAALADAGVPEGSYSASVRGLLWHGLNPLVTQLLRARCRAASRGSL